MKFFRVYVLVQAENAELALQDFNENKQYYENFNVEEIEE